MEVILAGALLFLLVGSLSTTKITHTIMIGKYAYGESSDSDENFFSISKFFEPKPIGIIKKNSTQIMNQDNSAKSTSKQKAEIKKVVKQFEKEFHDIQIKSVEFSISFRQYYTDKTLMLEYHAMFEYMMGSFFIIRKITDYLDDKKKILDLVSSYNKHSNFLHDMMIDLELKLIVGDLQIK